MTQTHKAEPAQIATVARTCPACGSARMGLVLLRPSVEYHNLDECVYRCACGEEATYVMMRPDGAVRDVV
jgi:hypothetical protein